MLQQQARFDAFQTCYNRERPHQALGMKVPGELYTPSPRPYRGLPTLDYPFHDWTATVTNCGRIWIFRELVDARIVWYGIQTPRMREQVLTGYGPQDHV